jgi:hypothetical protein
MGRMTRVEADRIYDASLKRFRAASAEFRKVTQRYRNREIGDREFIKARQTFKEEEAIADSAERAFIDECNIGFDSTV